MKRLSGDFSAAVQRVGAIHQNVRLDDRNKAAFLADGSVACERVSICHYAFPRGQALVYPNNSPPFGKLRTEGAVLVEAICEPIQPLGDHFTLGVGKSLHAQVDLDSGNYPAIEQKIREPCSIRAELTDCLVMQDGAAYKARCLWRGEQELPISAPAFRVGFDLQSFETPGYSADCFVSRQDPFAVGHQGSRGRFESSQHHD